MKLEFEPNTINSRDWWFDIGVSIQKTLYHPGYKYCFAISLALFTFYVRWGNWNKI